jgi:hypothetical protein
LSRTHFEQATTKKEEERRKEEEQEEEEEEEFEEGGEEEEEEMKEENSGGKRKKSSTAGGRKASKTSRKGVSENTRGMFVVSMSVVRRNRVHQSLINVMNRAQPVVPVARKARQQVAESHQRLK